MRSKEHLVFTDVDGTVFHYVVEGISLKDGTKVPPEVSSKRPLSLLFKMFSYTSALNGLSSSLVSNILNICKPDHLS